MESQLKQKLARKRGENFYYMNIEKMSKTKLPRQWCPSGKSKFDI